ncbi:hypothetical protein FRC09_007821 [Ceratobasidium sp. 395]|nr:hypothetical protein FRC09_007821 [Ceratobasidium sp. 395]
MDAPPPYYTTAAALQAEHRDLASTIRVLSHETIKVDDQFQVVYVELKRQEMFDESPDTPSKQWAAIRKLFTDILWSTRTAAGHLKTHTTDLVDAVLPAIAGQDADKAGKMADLTEFIEQPAPSLLTTERVAEEIAELKKQLGAFTDRSAADLSAKISPAKQSLDQLEKESQNQAARQKESEEASRGLFGLFHKPQPPTTELIDYDGRIRKIEDDIAGWEKLNACIVNGVREICTGLDTIPDRVGKIRLTVVQEKEDAEYLRQAVEASPDGNVQDVTIAVSAYKQVKDALHYYGTNVNKSGP